MKSLKQLKINNPVEILFICNAIIFGLLFSFATIAWDDSQMAPLIGNTVKEQLLYDLHTYHTWTSRIIINAVWYIILGNGTILYVLYMGICMYVLVKALYLLFGKENNYKSAVLAVFVAMLFPFHLLTSAGWIATTVTYYGPGVFCLMSLVPMRKMWDGEKIKPLELVWFLACSVYAANTEQISVTLIFLYTVFVVCMLIRKRIRWEMFLFLAIDIGSLIFTLTCPGNWNRYDSEIKLFPTYEMLDTVDKIELATSRTLKWIYIDGTLITIFFLGLVCYVVWKKYQEKEFRLIAAVPFMIAILLGPLYEATRMVFPKITKLNTDINYYGAINVASQGKGIGLMQVFVLLALSLCVLISLMLVNDTVFGFVADVALVVIGVGTGAMIGLSPTVYASAGRTYSALAFCVMLLILHIYYNNKEYFTGKVGTLDATYVEYGVIILSFLNLAGIIMTEFNV